MRADTGDAGRHERCRVDLSVRSRRREDGEVGNAGNDTRNRRHHRDGGKGPLAARHIERHRIDGEVAVAGEGARPDFLQPHRLRQLLLVKAADVVDRVADCLGHFRIDAREGFVELRFGDLQGLLGERRRLVQFAPEADECCISLLAHGVDDGPGLLEIDGQVCLGPSRQVGALGRREVLQCLDVDVGHRAVPLCGGGFARSPGITSTSGRSRGRPACPARRWRGPPWR